jgi:enterobactin synthetase component F
VNLQKPIVIFAVGPQRDVRPSVAWGEGLQFTGPTETTVWSTAFELEEIGAHQPPIGRPIPNTQVYVLDEARQPVPTGTVGELLYTGGAGVAKGYPHRSKLTEERLPILWRHLSMSKEVPHDSGAPEAERKVAAGYA